MLCRRFSAVLALLAAATLQAATPQEQFEALQKQYKAAQEQVWADAEKAANQDDRLRIFRERDPANTMVADFLKLEEQTRGTQLGLSILHHLVSVAYNSYGGNPEFAAT